MHNISTIQGLHTYVVIVPETRVKDCLIFPARPVSLGSSQLKVKLKKSDL